MSPGPLGGRHVLQQQQQQLQHLLLLSASLLLLVLLLLLLPQMPAWHDTLGSTGCCC